MKYLMPSNGMVIYGEGVVHFTEEGMRILDKMLKDYSKKKRKSYKK